MDAYPGHNTPCYLPHPWRAHNTRRTLHNHPQLGTLLRSYDTKQCFRAWISCSSSAASICPLCRHRMRPSRSSKNTYPESRFVIASCSAATTVSPKKKARVVLFSAPLPAVFDGPDLISSHLTGHILHTCTACNYHACTPAECMHMAPVPADQKSTHRIINDIQLHQVHAWVIANCANRNTPPVLEVHFSTLAIACQYYACCHSRWQLLDVESLFSFVHTTRHLGPTLSNFCWLELPSVWMRHPSLLFADALHVGDILHSIRVLMSGYHTSVSISPGPRSRVPPSHVPSHGACGGSSQQQRGEKAASGRKQEGAYHTAPSSTGLRLASGLLLLCVQRST